MFNPCPHQYVRILLAIVVPFLNDQFMYYLTNWWVHSLMIKNPLKPLQKLSRTILSTIPEGLAIQCMLKKVGMLHTSFWTLWLKHPLDQDNPQGWVNCTVFATYNGPKTTYRNSLKVFLTKKLLSKFFA